jgi:excisionase family DNA binding protein
VHDRLRDREWFSLRECRTVTGLSPRTLRHRIRDGVLPASWVGGAWRVHRDDLAEFMNGRKETA